MRLRILYLFAPVLIVAAVLLVLASLRPPVNGSLTISGAKELAVGIRKNEPLHLQSLDAISEIVIRDVPVKLEADQILVEGLKDRGLSAILIEPSQQLQVSHDLPTVTNRALSLTIESDTTTSLLLAQQPAYPEDGFYVDFSSPDPKGCEFKISYQAKAPEIVLTVKGAKIKNLIQSEKEEIASISPDQALEIRLISKDSDSSISILPGARASQSFLSVKYQIPKEDGEAQIFSEPESSRLHLDGTSFVKSVGRAALFINGLKTSELNHVALVVQGEKIAIPTGVKGTRKGLNTEFRGKFSYLGSMPEDSNAEQGVKESNALLPTRLSKVSGFYAILFAAIAYLIDKLVTIHKFLRPSA